jgi:glycosyltransferase involved in cell wall biosynthesis
LNSVLRQKGEDVQHGGIEIICVDDASTDKHTTEILSKYESKHNNIKVFQHAKNRGVSAARNTIIENSTGKKIMFLDSDDYLAGEYNLQTLYSRSYALPDIGMTSGSMLKRTDDKGVYMPESWKEYYITDKDMNMEGKQTILLWNDKQISSCNKLFDGKVVRESIRFDTTYTYFEDVKFVADYVIKMPFTRALYTPECKYVYRKHPASAVNKLDSAERGMRIVEFYANQMCYYLDLLEKCQKEFGVDSVAYKAILEQLLKNIGKMRKAQTSGHTRELMNSILKWMPPQCPECAGRCSIECSNHRTLDCCLTKAKALMADGRSK